eukprot:3532861-Amphidinium_carterae.1
MPATDPHTVYGVHFVIAVFNAADGSHVQLDTAVPGPSDARTAAIWLSAQTTGFTKAWRSLCTTQNQRRRTPSPTALKAPCGGARVPLVSDGFEHQPPSAGIRPVCGMDPQLQYVFGVSTRTQEFKSATALLATQEYVPGRDHFCRILPDPSRRNMCIPQAVTSVIARGTAPGRVKFHHREATAMQARIIQSIDLEYSKLNSTMRKPDSNHPC